MRTFCISTLGCKVNQYESEQLAALLRARGMVPAPLGTSADIHIVNTCSVTVQAASKSRQTVRQVVRLPVLNSSSNLNSLQHSEASAAVETKPTDQEALVCAQESVVSGTRRQRVIVTGCWATSDKAAAQRLPGVNAVIGHHDNIVGELDRLLTLWQSEDLKPPAKATDPITRDDLTRCDLTHRERSPEPLGDEGWMIQASTPAVQFTADNKSHSTIQVKENIERFGQISNKNSSLQIGTRGLPLLDAHQESHQRGFLKIQDGCDAHCTYCIIPNLRPVLWSKPIHDVVEEAKRLVASGHRELVLTGIFLGAYGQETALRRRQTQHSQLGKLVEALCTQVRDLRRLRLSSLEPGDLTDELIHVLRSHEAVVPHFHLPLQSGSDALLQRMNRQYTRDQFLGMIERVNAAFDRPAITTDIIVGFPGETDERFEETAQVASRSGFIHIHAFSFSPRPGTAANRWQREFVRGPIVNERIDRLRRIADEQSFRFRQMFIGEIVELLVERENAGQTSSGGFQHGRCPRYFIVHFEGHAAPGDLVQVHIDRVTTGRTMGTRIVATESLAINEAG